MMLSADEIIRILDLHPLAEEGGFYRETYRSAENVSLDALPDRYTTSKRFATAIYYLLIPDTCSRLHRLPTDETYHFYFGDPVIMLNLYPGGMSRVIVLGPAIDKGEQVQFTVPRGVWQGSFLKRRGSFALLGTTMAPGFDSTDYEAGERNRLVQEYPGLEEMIVRLTPPVAGVF
ncbi:MAG: cupin domain-containing protein [Dehalococcoidales bacterium]|nr:cupin domain-containing protein [Dehalococcoidales bacterium]